MIVSTASLAGLAFAALVTAAVYPLVVRLGGVRGTARSARAFRLGYPLAGTLLVGSLAATTYATEHRFSPTAEESPVDPGLLFDLGLAGTMLGFLAAIGLLAWIALASSRDTAGVTGEAR